MNKPTVASMILLFGYPILNVGAVIAIVKIDHWFLVSLTYPIIFGVVAPLVVLGAFWAIIGSSLRANIRSFILPGVATLIGLLCGGLHFFIIVIASASV